VKLSYLLPLAFLSGALMVFLAISINGAFCEPSCGFSLNIVRDIVVPGMIGFLCVFLPFRVFGEKM